MIYLKLKADKRCVLIAEKADQNKGIIFHFHDPVIKRHRYLNASFLEKMHSSRVQNFVEKDSLLNMLVSVVVVPCMYVT